MVANSCGRVFGWFLRQKALTNSLICRFRTQKGARYLDPVERESADKQIKQSLTASPLSQKIISQLSEELGKCRAIEQCS